MKTSLVTCSYAPDFDRCQNLCASATRHLPQSIEHVLLVPRRDLELFKPLANQRTRIITAESIFPGWIRRVPLSTKWWLTPYTLPVRGWIIQQITKLSAPLVIDSDILLFADSDVTFVRPFDPASIVQGDRVRLYRVPGAANMPSHQRWHRLSGQLLGIPPKDYYGSDYIGQLVCWRRDTTLKLHAHLENVHSRDWRRLICGSLHFSEYILYGIFAEFVLGEQSGHYYDATDLCHCSWHHTLQNAGDVAKFLEQIRPEQVAVLVQSKLPFTPAEYDKMIKLLENAGHGIGRAAK